MTDGTQDRINFQFREIESKKIFFLTRVFWEVSEGKFKNIAEKN